MVGTDTNYSLVAEYGTDETADVSSGSSTPDSDAPCNQLGSVGLPSSSGTHATVWEKGSWAMILYRAATNPRDRNLEGRFSRQVQDTHVPASSDS